MPSIFLSHTHADRPFVEKLAVDLKRVGVNVWFDKWNIGVGDSITWKVEEGVNGHLNLPTFGQTFSPPPLSFADVSNR